MPRKATDFAARVWAQVDQSGGEDACWPWKGYVVNGHAIIYPRHSGAKDCGSTSTTAQHFVYEVTHGPIAWHRKVRPTCGERLCCNPGHLRLATTKR